LTSGCDNFSQKIFSENIFSENISMTQPDPSGDRPSSKASAARSDASADPLPDQDPDQDPDQTAIAKAQWRDRLLQQRLDLSPQQWRQDSDRLVQRLLNLPIFTQARQVLAFCSFRQEPDISGLWFEARADGARADGARTDGASTDGASTEALSAKTWGLPRCVGSDLVFHRYLPGQALTPGRFGILEPAPSWPDISPEAVDLIVVPCVGCDRQGYRLGYGGGYYDRLLSQPQWARKTTLGLTFRFGYVDRLPRDPWDRPLNWIATPDGIFLGSAAP
jgi:5-formyltetrahydrofolate cyclo-ligase